VLKHIISIFIWTAIGLYLLLVILLHIPYIQKNLGSQVASAISHKLDAKVSIGRVDFGFLNRFIIDDVIIYDRKGKEMIKAARISARIELIPLTEGKVLISSAQIFSSHFSLYRETENAKPNFQFVLDALASKDTTSHTPLDLRINTFIMQRGNIKYDRYDKPHTSGMINPSHLDIRNISAHISLKALKEDSVNIAIKKLAFNEQSGFKLNKLSLKMEGNRKQCKLKEFNLKLPGTELTIDSIKASYEFKGDSIGLPTIKFAGEIKKSAVSPSDFACFLPALKSFNHKLHISSLFNGRDCGIDIPRLTINSDDNSLALFAGGYIKKNTEGVAWYADIKESRCSQDALQSLLNSTRNTNEDINRIISKLGDISLSGHIKSQNKQNGKAQCQIGTGAGSLNISANLANGRLFNGDVKANGIDLKEIFENDEFGIITADVVFDGIMNDNKPTLVNTKGNISELDYKGYRYSNITIDGQYADNGIQGVLNINDPNIALNIEGAVNNISQTPDVNLNASVRNFSPQAVRLTRKWGDASFSAYITAQLKGIDIKDAVGKISIDDFIMSKPDERFAIDSIRLQYGYDNSNRFLTVNSDFGTAEIIGRFDHNTLGDSFKHFIKSKLPSFPGIKNTNKKASNDFLLRADIKNTDWLEKLFYIPFRLLAPMSLDGDINDLSHDIFLNCRIPHFTYDGKEYKNASISISSPDEALHGNIRIAKIMDNDDVFDLDVTADAIDDRLATSLTWSNNARRKQSGTINAITMFALDDENKPTANIAVKPSHANINDTIWNIPSSNITYRNNKIEVDRFSIQNNKQHIIIDGTASRSATDSIKVELNDIDIEYILDLVNFHSVDFSGRATGHAYISSALNDMSANAKITVDNFLFEHGRMGILNAYVDWNKKEKQIDIKAVANDGPTKSTLINGYVSPARNYIDLEIQAIGTRIEFIKSFTSSFISDINGEARGAVRLYGPLSTINLTGMLVLNGDATISPLNCKYYLKEDTVTLIPDEIELRNIPIFDKFGNRGEISGGIHHKHLTRLSYDLSVKADNLLAYDFHDFGNETFYGTVFGTGEVDIHGRSGEVLININITPQKNSQFVYNVSNPDAIVNQEFIQWGSATAGNDTIAAERKQNEEKDIRKLSSDMHINFLINCTPDATIKLLMDSKTNDYITLNGNGVLRASYYNKGAFNMFGTYRVTNGTYGITIQDIIKKSFVFNDGGTIQFGGNPFDAGLNLQAIHTVNGVSLSDLNIGNSFSNNTVRVNCLMNISGTPGEPQISFDLDVPTVSTDEKQMIRSVINSEDEMSQQVLYLLGVGRFYPKENNNAGSQNENQKSNTSLAMQGLLSGTISSQINSVLNTVINSKNWNFGANISTGNDGWDNAEYEGLLSGRLLNNRLLINGQFGYRDNASTANTSFIGDFDIRYLLFPNGNLSVNVYNKTNDRYFTKSSLNTQGIGLIMKKDFSNLKDLFGINKKKKKKSKRQKDKPLIDKE
jgi:hypothetical protein